MQTVSICKIMLYAAILINVTSGTIHDDVALVRAHVASNANGTFRTPSGFLNHPYLVPSGPYNQSWEWDSLFMGVALREHGSIPYLGNEDLHVHVCNDLHLHVRESKTNRVESLFLFFFSIWFAHFLISNFTFLSSNNRILNIVKLLLICVFEHFLHLNLCSWHDAKLSRAHKCH